MTGPTTNGAGDETIARSPLPNPFAPELVSGRIVRFLVEEDSESSQARSWRRSIRSPTATRSTCLARAAASSRW